MGSPRGAPWRHSGVPGGARGGPGAPREVPGSQRTPKPLVVNILWHFRGELENNYEFLVL